jgi:NADH-quinone oxidoreductase subunit L
MVAAGVFLVVRMHPLLAADVTLTTVPVHALSVVAAVGGVTAVFGAVVAVAQHDIKRVLAFSTVSQLGYMMLAAGTGAWIAAIFHLLTHACFKALLFLGAGSVIHATHHQQDIRVLGGLRGRLPVTCATFTVGMMALAGVPFLFSGFWSKEAILHAAHGWPVSPFPFLAALAAVPLTAFYMTRLLAEVFAGAPRSHAAESAHESPAVMTIPLVVLAVASVGLGFLGTPWWPWLQRTLDPTAQPAPGGAGLMGVSITLVGAGIFAGWARYGRHPRATPQAPDPLARSVPRLYRALAARLRCDEFYAATLGRLNAALGTAAATLDRSAWDGGIRLLARLGAFTGLVSRETDEEVLNGGFNATGDGLRATGRAYARTQTGDAHGYLWMLAAGFVLLALAGLLGGGR